MNEYVVALYSDPDTLRERWAVMHTGTRVFYFPNKYGKDRAQRLARKMNNEASQKPKSA